MNKKDMWATVASIRSQGHTPYGPGIFFTAGGVRSIANPHLDIVEFVGMINLLELYSWAVGLTIATVLCYFWYHLTQMQGGGTSGSSSLSWLRMSSYSF